MPAPCTACPCYTSPSAPQNELALMDPSWLTFEPSPLELELSPGADVQALTEFTYSPDCVESQALTDVDGCCCSGGLCGADAGCSCAAECERGLRALKAHGRAAGVVLLIECGAACACGPACLARTSQQGVSLRLALSWNRRKGWCVRALERIGRGTFVCVYAGEYVSTGEARRRLAQYDCDGRGHALLAVRVQLPSGSSSLVFAIDATRTGNIGRFINHSCDGGNLEPVIVSAKGALLPRVALFAAADILPGDELAFSYASGAPAEPAGGGAGGSRTRCACGTPACSGFLPATRV